MAIPLLRFWPTRMRYVVWQADATRLHCRLNPALWRWLEAQANESVARDGGYIILHFTLSLFPGNVNIVYSTLLSLVSFPNFSGIPKEEH